MKKQLRPGRLFIVTERERNNLFAIQDTIQVVDEMNVENWVESGEGWDRGDRGDRGDSHENTEDTVEYKCQVLVAGCSIRFTGCRRASTTPPRVNGGLQVEIPAKWVIWNSASYYQPLVFICGLGGIISVLMFKIP